MVGVPLGLVWHFFFFHMHCGNAARHLATFLIAEHTTGAVGVVGAADAVGLAVAEGGDVGALVPPGVNTSATFCPALQWDPTPHPM